MVRKSIALVLSGGGARGLAHVGVLKALEQLQIPISAICGCSMGGLIASLYALGKPTDEIEKIARKYSSTREMIKLVDLTPRRRGYIISQHLRSFLSRLFDENVQFSQTKIPLAVNAVDLLSGQEVVLDHGSLLDAVLATTAIPGFFSPLQESTCILADGGVVNNLPVSLIKGKTLDPIVAVDVHQAFGGSFRPSAVENPYPKSFFPQFAREYYLAELIKIRKMTDLNLAQNPPDLLLTPVIDPNINLFFGFTHIAELIEAGEEVVYKNSESILKLLG